MAFSEFRYPDVLDRLSVREEQVASLFADVPPVEPGPALRAWLPQSVPLGTTAHSEAARAIWIVGPVLADLWNRFPNRLNLLAGVDFQADAAAGLNGYVDFILCEGIQRFTVSAPVCLIFEAKRDSIPDGLGQAIAGMVGAQRYNAREGHPIDPIYGCVTTGSLWRFLRLSGATLTSDRREYFMAEVEEILGVLSSMIRPVGGTAAA
jgi:hypothetical protein